MQSGETVAPRPEPTPIQIEPALSVPLAAKPQSAARPNPPKPAPPAPVDTTLASRLLDRRRNREDE
jgi:hypothetical protein